jgi:hypothetical protein
MTEEESGSVFGGLSEVAGAAWDAAGNTVEAAAESFGAVGLTMDIGFERMAAGAAYAVGETDTASSIDAATSHQADIVTESFSDAGDKLSDAWTDIVGE